MNEQTRILMNGREVGVVLAEDAQSDPNIAPILIDPNCLEEVADADNPNFMTEETFASLQKSITRFGAIESIPIYFKTWELKKDGLHVTGPKIINGAHRKRASCAAGLKRMLAIWMRQLEPGEEQVLRITLNRLRGDHRIDVERRLLKEAAAEGWSPADLDVTGYPETRIEAIIGETDAPPLQLNTENVAAFLPETSTETEEASGAGGVLEIKCRTGAELKHIKAALGRGARAVKAKGEFRLTEGLLQLIRQAEGEDEDEDVEPEAD